MDRPSIFIHTFKNLALPSSIDFMQKSVDYNKIVISSKLPKFQGLKTGQKVF